MSTHKVREALKRACEIWEDEKNYTAEDAGHNLWCNAIKAIRLLDEQEARVKALVEAGKEAGDTFESIWRWYTDDDGQGGRTAPTHQIGIRALEGMKSIRKAVIALEAFKEDSKSDKG